MRVDRRVTTLAAAWLLTAVPLAAAQDLASVEIRPTEVQPGVWMLEGQGGNIGVSAGDEGVLIIDDQFAPLIPRIRAALERIRPGAVRFVLNTHWHGDHSGGNELLGRAGAVIVAHDAVRERLSSDQTLRGRPVPAAPAIARPVISFADGVTFHFNGEVIRVEHVPHAHTDGDAIVRFERANVLHLGDVFFAGRYPFIDLDSGGSVEGMLAAIDRGLALADEQTRIIPGHGPLSTRADLQRYRDAVAEVLRRARAARAAGTDLETWVAGDPTADLDATWGAGFVGPEAFQRTVWTATGAAAP